MTQKQVLIALLVVLAGLALWQFGVPWPPVLDDFRGCSSDAECVATPGCHPIPVAVSRRAAWEAYVAGAHCGPSVFAATSVTPTDAWLSWLEQIVAQRGLCPSNPATASIVCETSTETACGGGGHCVLMTKDEGARPAKKPRH